MPEILTYNTPGSIEKEKTKQHFYISFFDWFSSQDRFTKTYIIVFLLIILSTPFIVNNYLETRQRAAPSPVVTPPLPIGGDTQAPNVAISSPQDQSTVLGSVAINASAKDNVGVVKMEIYIDGRLMTKVNNTTSVFFNWNTEQEKYKAGAHTVKATAYDVVGNVGSSSVSVIK